MKLLFAFSELAEQFLVLIRIVSLVRLEVCYSLVAQLAFLKLQILNRLLTSSLPSFVFSRRLWANLLRRFLFQQSPRLEASGQKEPVDHSPIYWLRVFLI